MADYTVLKNVLSVVIDSGTSRDDVESILDTVIKERNSHVVYFAYRDGFVKIGTTGSLSSRVAAINRGDGAINGMTISPVNLLATMPGGLIVEQAIHRTFYKLRYEGEWFLFEEPLIGFVGALGKAGGITAGGVFKSNTVTSARSYRVQTVLEDVYLVMSLNGWSRAHWTQLAIELTQVHSSYIGITAKEVSMSVRKFGVSCQPVSVGGRKSRGCRMLEIERAIKRKEDHDLQC